MRTIWRAMVGACLVAAVVCAAACAGGDDDGSATASADAPQSVKLAYFKGAPTSGMAVLAQEQQLFEKHGLDVKLQEYTTGPAGVTLLLSGEVDYLSGVGPPLMVPTVEQGACMQYLTAEEGNVVDIIARPGLTLPNAGKPYPAAIQDLRGKKVGIVVRGGAGELWLGLALKDGGLDPKRDVTLVATGAGPTAAKALQEGRVDASYSAPPMQSILGDDGYQMVAKMAGKPGNALSDVIQAGTIAGCDRIQKQPEQVKSFCSAMWDAFAYASDPANQAKMEDFMTRFLGVEPDVGAEVWRDYKATFSGAEITPAAWQKQQRYLPEGMKLPSYEEAVYGPCAQSDPDV